MDVAVPARALAARPGRLLPAWASVLAVVAHPDDESLGLGAVIDRLAAAGAVLAGQHAGLPVRAWALPQAVASPLRAETGHDFAGQPPCMIALEYPAPG